MIVDIILIVLGFILLINGADILVDGSSNLAKKLHIPQLIIGLTIVSIGTSMPELFVSVTSIISGYEDISLGNIIGSNICNLLLILGVSSLINPLLFKRQTKKIEIPLNLISSIVLLTFCNSNNYISTVEGIILFLMCILFIIYTIVIFLRSNPIKEKKSEFNENNKIIPNILSIFLSIIILKIGADLAVDNCVKIAKTLHISEKVIGLTIIAIGTSLPELVTSITAAIKKNSDIAIGNIIGSNIFNIFLILGFTSIIRPIPYNISYNFQLYILILSSILLLIFPYIGRKNELSRHKGLIYLLIYIIYISFLLIN